MLRKIGLTSLLLLGCDLSASALDPGGDVLPGAAEAADFTGKIKRIQIKKRRVGSGFKVVARTQGDTADAAGTVKVELVPLDGGPALAPIPRSVNSLYEMDARLSDEGVYTYSFTAEINGAKETFLFEGMVLDGPWVEDTTEDGSVSVRMRLADNGEGGATALGGALERDHDTLNPWDVGAAMTSGSFTDGTSALDKATLTSVNERFVGELAVVEDPTGYRYQMTSTLLDATGAVVDVQTEQLTLSDGGEDDGIQTVKLRENKKGVARAVTITNSLDGAVAALEVQLTGKEGEYVIDAYDTEPVSVERWFQVGGVEFEPGEPPIGHTYIVLADMIDNNGDPFGEQQEFEVSIDGIDERTAPNGDGLPGNTVGVFDAPLTFGTVEVEEDGTYTFFFAFAGEGAELVEQVNLLFEEPFGGPAPLEIEANFPLVLEWKKWVQKGNAALPAVGELTVNVVSDEGEVLDSVAASTAGEGAAFVDDGGNGTRKYGDILIDGVPLEFD